MALFTDGPLSTIDELREHDSQLADVASTEGIDVTRKLALAKNELQIELETLLNRATSGGARRDVTKVVATPELKLWHIYRTLEMFYGDAYYSHLNNRYKKKRRYFETLAAMFRGRIRVSGVGMVTVPVPRAETPELASASGIVPAGTYFVTMAWVNAAGEEGAAATPGTYTVPEIPPDPGADQSFAVVAQSAPATATGWNVYAGTNPDELVLQNLQPLALGEVWFATDPLETEGRHPGSGQEPNFYEVQPRVFQRG